MDTNDNALSKRDVQQCKANRCNKKIYGRPLYYKLKGHEPVPCDKCDKDEFTKAFDISNRRVRYDKIGKVSVSTVFLVIDHCFSMKGEPILFETMVFGGRYEGEMRRYTNWDEAERGHEEMLQMVKAGDTLFYKIKHIFIIIMKVLLLNLPSKISKLLRKLKRTKNEKNTKKKEHV